jgi:hypothetical protein
MGTTFSTSSASWSWWAPSKDTSGSDRNRGLCSVDGVVMHYPLRRTLPEWASVPRCPRAVKILVPEQLISTMSWEFRSDASLGDDDPLRERLSWRTNGARDGCLRGRLAQSIESEFHKGMTKQRPTEGHRWRARDPRFGATKQDGFERKLLPQVGPAVA